jgi:hypothetical protein
MGLKNAGEINGRLVVVEVWHCHAGISQLSYRLHKVPKFIAIYTNFFSKSTALTNLNRAHIYKELIVIRKAGEKQKKDFYDQAGILTKKEESSEKAKMDK